MNVSFTRARKKLVIFGSRKTLQREPLLASFFELMEKQRWIVALSPNAHTAHARVFDVASTPSKRGAVDEEEQEEQQSVDDRARKSAVVCRKVKKENAGVEGLRPMKKLKAAATDVGKKAGAGVLKGRPILRDLVGHEM
jgi:DNA replication ATP-dependent helicase Dna2